MKTSNTEPTPEERRAGIYTWAEDMREKAILGKALYEKDRSPRAAPWEDLPLYVMRVYIERAVQQSCISK